MSIRGSVAWDIHGFIIGVYNGDDSNPAGLGRRVWHYAKNLGISGLKSRLQGYGDWVEFEHGGVCEYCGKVTGQPLSVQVTNLLVQRDTETGLFPSVPDAEARYHEHGNSARDHFEPFKDAQMVHWIYILDEQFNAVEVWFRAPEYGVYKYRNLGFQVSGIVDDGFTHVLFRKLSLDNDYPDWTLFEKEFETMIRMVNHEEY